MRATLLLLALALAVTPAHAMEVVRVSEDGTGFVLADSGAPFRAWGVNYDHDHAGRLLEAYWADAWDTVVEDFHEIRDLGANVVRVHLQLGAFMASADTPDAAALARLAKLVKLAEQTGLYLDITGLACYHKDETPAWYDALPEAERWAVQARFWEAVAKNCASSPAIFCYDLMNEPILPGETPETEWLAGEFAGKYFVQRIALDLAGRTREAVAKAWVDTLVTAIRRHDPHHLVTVGVIPWAKVWPNAKPLFHGPEVGRRLDFVSVHFYPEAGEVDKALAALKVYEVGKPLVVEEMFPLSCSADELIDFIDRSRDFTDGYVSFYWGKRIEDFEAEADLDLSGALTKEWLERFRAKSAEMTASPAE